MEKQEKMIWYEVTLGVLPGVTSFENKVIRYPRFYVNVTQWEQYEEYGKIRLSINPHIGKYDNFEEFDKRVQGRDDIQSIVIADTIIEKQMALDLEEQLVKCLKTCEMEHGFNKKVGE